MMLKKSIRNLEEMALDMSLKDKHRVISVLSEVSRVAGILEVIDLESLELCEDCKKQALKSFLDKQKKD